MSGRRHPCRNAAAGCRFEFASWDLMKEHLPVCEYRPIRCPEFKNVDCEGRVISLNEFACHLIHDHNCLHEQLVDGTFVGISTRHGLDQHVTMPLRLLMYDGETFLIHEVQMDLMIYRWITVIGGLAEAQKYNYFMKFSSNKEVRSVASHTNKFTYTLPVLAMNDFMKFSNVVESGNFGSIHSKTLETVCDKTPLPNPGINGPRIKYSWKTHITFTKSGY